MIVNKNNREFGVGNSKGRGFVSFKANDILTPKHDWDEGIVIHGFEITQGLKTTEWSSPRKECLWNKKTGEFEWTGNMECKATVNIEIPRWTFKQPKENSKGECIDDGKDFSVWMQMEFDVAINQRGALKVGLNFADKRIPMLTFNERHSHVQNWSRGQGNIDDHVLLWTSIKKIRPLFHDAIDILLELESGLRTSFNEKEWKKIIK
tara:strand:- start:39 stop:659 length:621 start_codon:yes stop_codon:yes gene_type:complete